MFALHARANQVPSAAELFAAQIEFQMPLVERLVEVADRLPGAVVPDVDVATAVFTLGNIALEIRITDRVIFHLDREPFIRRIE